MDGVIEINLSPLLTFTSFKTLKIFLLLLRVLIPELIIFFTYSLELPSNAGNSGAFIIATGKAPAENGQAGGRGGDVNIRVGTGASGDGGDVLMFAGETTEAGKAGGNVVIAAGEGSSVSSPGGNGGKVQVFGGAGQGTNEEDDTGGNIEMAGGFGNGGVGGSFIVRTGYGFSTSSGLVDIATANAGSAGVSGEINLFTGTTSSGNSGLVRIETGWASGGRGGAYSLLVGTGNTGTGGMITVRSGKTTASASGGNIKVYTGYSTQTSSGDYSVETVNSGIEGVSGKILFDTGDTTKVILVYTKFKLVMLSMVWVVILNFV